MEFPWRCNVDTIAMDLKVSWEMSVMGISNYKVEVEGHTDDVPINTARFPSNWELSAARSSAVVRFLISRGVEPKRMGAIGYADTRPKKPHRDKEGNPILNRFGFVRDTSIFVNQGEDAQPCQKSSDSCTRWSV